jgi:hypothetical protein
MKNMRTIIPFLLLLPLSQAFPQDSVKTFIEGRTDYFGEYLSTFQPGAMDSTEAMFLKSELTEFIDTVIALGNRNVLRWDEQYFNRIGELYQYGLKLSMPEAREMSNEYFEKALEVNPHSIDARMGLASNYYTKWNPEDSSTFKDLKRGFDYLMGVYRDGQDTLDPNLYQDLFVCGMYFESKAICCDAIFKFMKYFPNDTHVSKLESVIDSLKERCPQMWLKDHIITYRNDCAKFRVSYPDDFTLYQEITRDERDGRAVLMLETPLTETDEGDSIRNSISIIATPSGGTTMKQLVERFFKSGPFSRDSVRAFQSKRYRSIYFSSHFGIDDEFEGIITVTEHGGYFYEIGYTATVSTFEENLAKFRAFEKSFRTE